MRVLAVTNMYPTNEDRSVGTFVEQQVKGLKEAGVDVAILHLDRVRLGVQVYRDAGMLARRQAEAFGAEIVHVMYGGTMAERVTRAVQDRPVVVSFCGSDLLGEPLPRLAQRLAAFMGVRLSHLAARRAAGVVVKSEGLRLALPTDLDKAKVRIIPNGIDLARFKPLDHQASMSSLGWDPGRFHILFPANNGTPRKRPALAQAAVDALREMGVPAELHRLQGVAHADVPLWLNASDVVLLTSQHEGSPNIVKEALACNRPVVSVDVGDVKERISGIEGCFLASPDAADLAAKLRLVVDRGEAVSSRDRIEHLSLPNVARQLQHFYSEILDRAPGNQRILLASREKGAAHTNSYPTVTVIMPVRNEAGYIAQSLRAVLDQDYPAPLVEIIVADGMSTDGTREVVLSMQSEFPQIQIIDNPRKIVPTGLNRAITLSRGEIIVRIDGHCRIARDYIRRCVDHLMKDGVDGVGGPVRTVGQTLTAQAIAAAMSSPFGVGGSSFRTVQDRNVLADTIPFPAYTREAIHLAGAYDEEQVRNQDDEFNYRLRKLGAKILLAHDVRSDYYSRSTLSALWAQYYQYGYWKVRVLQKHPRQMCPEQFVPLFFVLALLASAGFALISPLGSTVFLFGTATYATAALAATAHRVRGEKKMLALIIPFAFVMLHGGYGFGFLVGLLRFWRRWGKIPVYQSTRRLGGIPGSLSAGNVSEGA